jgi:hypothetical protein
MYEQQCKDVFGGAVGKAVASLKQYKLTPEHEAFWTSAVNLGGDYSWLLLALAKAYNGELDNTDIIQDNWNKVCREENKFWTDAGKIAEKFPEQYFFWGSLHNLAHAYIQEAHSEMETNVDPDGLWHPYGFLSHLSAGLMLSWEFHTVLLKEAESFANMKDKVKTMFEEIAELTAEAHISLQKMRLALANQQDVFEQSVKYTTMYQNATSIKDFRNSLFQLCSTEMLREEAIGSGIDGLLRDLAKGGRLEVLELGRPATSQRRSGLPPDIDGMKFDD